MADAVLAAIILVPLVLAWLLKSNGALAFLALAGSFTLITLGSAELQDLTGHLDIQIDANTLNLAVLGLPLLVTLLLTRKTFSDVKKFKPILHLTAALCAGGLLALVSVPLLNATARTNFADSSGWASLQKIQVPVVAAGLIISLLLIWFQKQPHAKKHKK
ncbi:MAG TPA: hypothetical protein VFW52_00495 [Candidatus Saccharimonadales bacterium]|nr:hypothetical protein [Candidatus Saccharimonadales bacterium]